ncbi:MAG: hypothetical protein DCC65_18050 [Planctomycetota bacterium]|nr:MAG: hypothetical protein DCC65_18050 [Planctomycetota bacterium]
MPRRDSSLDHPRWILPVFLALGMLSISSSAIFVRLCDDAPPVVIAAARLGIATLILVPGLTLARGPSLRRIPRRLWPHILLGGAMLAAHFFFWMTSLRHTSVLSSVVIVTTNPIFVGIGSLVFFGERARRNLVLGIALAAAGGALITLAGGPAPDPARASGSTVYGNLLSLLGALTASGYLLIGRRVRADVDNLSYMLGVYGVAALILCAAAVAQGASFTAYRPITYLYFLLLAVAPQLIGHGSLNYALRHLSATLVAICILAEPVGASLLAYLILGESADRWQAAGAALILGGIFLAGRADAAPRPKNIEPDPRSD